jgi:DNA mismatch endonuclease (patch repair protein)
MTPEQRSYCMSRIKGKDTSLELTVRSVLHRLGLRFRKNYAGLPGKPDVVFLKARLAVFLDGDFWHGKGFSAWKGKMSEYWLNKISRNRKRDVSNRRKLRRMGWGVLRVWESEVKKDLGKAVERILSALAAAASAAGVAAPRPMPLSELALRLPPAKPARKTSRKISRKPTTPQVPAKAPARGRTKAGQASGPGKATDGEAKPNLPPQVRQARQPHVAKRACRVQKPTGQ